MPLEIIRNDITKVTADAIVNTANPKPVIGAGTDSAIHLAAGPELLEARKRIGEILPGACAETPAFGLMAKYVLHTVGPIVDGELTREHERLLASCYRSCLELASKNGCESIAFCCISTGVFCFPPERASEIAVDTVLDALRHGAVVRRVIFNVFKDSDLAIYQRLLQ